LPLRLLLDVRHAGRGAFLGFLASWPILTRPKFCGRFRSGQTRCSPQGLVLAALALFLI
jgi:hypothetical protein